MEDRSRSTKKPRRDFAIMRIIEWKTLLLPAWTDFGAVGSVDRMIAKIGTVFVLCAFCLGLYFAVPLKMTV